MYHKCGERQQVWNKAGGSKCGNVAPSSLLKYVAHCLQILVVLVLGGTLWLPPCYPRVFNKSLMNFLGFISLLCC